MEPTTMARKSGKLFWTATTVAARSTYAPWANESTNEAKTSNSADDATATNNPTTYCKSYFRAKKSIPADAY